ncbi:phage minor tail protein L [Paraburkholderia terrae]|uniref:Phage minor tail protein L n=1 Tax=Paraburkholderia terrae TaxID=311230 RepID=A0A2I8ETN4_9BURK|nr:phage minor tail protein L [Paraburkholderia terrae]AUT62879.1 phage minor tail protein L [Paraburkholderia terrae]
MTIRGDIQSLSPGAVIELFQLDLSRFGASVPIVCFHAGTNELDSDVVWQGTTYQRYPLQATGFEWKGQGTLPRPHFVVSNVTGIMSALCRLYRDMVGAKVVRKRTLLRYLDAVNFTDGNPYADPGESFPDDVFFINQKVREDNATLELELAVAFDVEGVQLPRRQVVCNSCPWKYRGDGCGYAGGPVADVNDNPTSDASKDQCGKRLASCKLRFPTGTMPYGGFPGAGQYR